MYSRRAQELPDPRAGKQYLGEFRVTEAAGQTATIVPTLDMTDFQRQRLSSSHGPWQMYETMPPDRHDIFANTTPEEEAKLRQMIPEVSLQEYLRDGKEAVTDDDPHRVIGLDENGKRLPADQMARAAKKIYERRLRDYGQEFRKLAGRRAVLITNREGLQSDIQRLAGALASASG